jgi:hypothetical protein
LLIKQQDVIISSSLTSKLIKRTYSLFQKYIASVLLISFLLQSCGGSGNLLIEGDLSSATTIKKKENLKRGLIEQEQKVSSLNIFSS